MVVTNLKLLTHTNFLVEWQIRHANICLFKCLYVLYEHANAHANANAHGDGDGDGDGDGMLTRPNNQAMKKLPLMAENRFSN